MPSPCKVIVDCETDSLPPLIAVSFTHGVLDRSKHGSIKTKVYQHQESENIKKLVISAGEMDYAGNYNALKRDDGKYIGVEDPDSKTITLFPLKRVRLRPAISIAQEGEEDMPAPKKTFQEQNDSIIASFGGAKQKQNMLRRKKHGINKDMIYEALDTAGVENLPLRDTKQPSKAEEEQQLLPRHDLEATDSKDCYPVDGYFPENIRLDMEGFVDDMMEVDADTLQTWKTSKRYPEYVLGHLERLPLAEHQRKVAAIYIKYMFYLMKLYQFRAADLKQKDPFASGDTSGICQMPASCFRHLLDSYTVKSGTYRSLPPRLKDRALIVILLLAFQLEEFTQVSTNSIVSDLKVGIKRLISIAKAMGCKVRKADQRRDVPEIVIQLVAPLNLPTAGHKTKPKPKPRSR